MEPETAKLQKQYIKHASNFLSKQNTSQEVYDLYLDRFIEDIKNIDPTKH